MKETLRKEFYSSEYKNRFGGKPMEIIRDMDTKPMKQFVSYDIKIILLLYHFF
jgi:hypothetical protein